MGKRKVETDSEDEIVDLEEEQPKPKKSRAKKKGPVEPYTDTLGWNIVPPSLLWKDYETEPSSKIAAFDLDGTLVNTKSSRAFPNDASDWKWYNKKTAQQLRDFHEDGFKLVIFTNQGGIKTALDGKAAAKVKERIDLIAADVGVPLQAFAAPSMADGDPCRKPATGMWGFFKDNCNGGMDVDLKGSFFVGDAAGRLLDHSDSDQLFAQAVGLPFKVPEDVFGPMEGKRALPSQARAPAVKKAAAGEGGGGGEDEVKTKGKQPRSGPNAELLELFDKISDAAFAESKEDPKKAFKGMAFRKAATALATFPVQITDGNLKQVGQLAGVGKGSLSLIKEYLSTGKIAAAEEVDAAKETKAAAPPPPVSKQHKEALAFM